MSFETPKVVLLGKSKEKNHLMQKILNDIKASTIPFQFLDSVFITVGAKEQRYEIKKKYLKEGLDYKNIEDHLVNLGITKDIHLIEVVIDLDDTYGVVRDEANVILDGLFDGVSR